MGGRGEGGEWEVVRGGKRKETWEDRDLIQFADFWKGDGGLVEETYLFFCSCWIRHGG